MSRIQIKRVYDEVHPSDGKRILVDRIWPRGLTKEKAALYLWMKEVAPSHELRKWFGHQPEKFDKFKEAYLAELTSDSEKMNLLRQIKEWAENETVTLVFAAKDENKNQAVVLLEIIERLP